MTGTGGAIDGLTVVFSQMSNRYTGQLGKGANGKNINHGFSQWLFWDIDLLSVTPCPVNQCSGHGDINVNVVPVPAALWLFGTALLGFIGFSRRTRI